MDTTECGGDLTWWRDSTRDAASAVCPVCGVTHSLEMQAAEARGAPATCAAAFKRCDVVRVNREGQP